MSWLEIPVTFNFNGPEIMPTDPNPRVANNASAALAKNLRATVKAIDQAITTAITS